MVLDYTDINMVVVVRCTSIEDGVRKRTEICKCLMLEVKELVNFF